MDTFKQGGVNQSIINFNQKPAVVDVLFVVRNGPAMCEKQQQLATKFTSFIDVLQQQNLDFHVAVTSTDFANPQFQGKFVAQAGNPYVLDGGTPNLSQVFSQNVAAVGYTGSAYSQDLLAGYAALTPPLSTGFNGGFLRSNASLAVIVVSDEDDKSLNAPPPPPQGDYFATFFIRSYAHLKGAGNEQLISLSAIVGADGGTPADCAGTATNPSCIFNDATGHAGVRTAAVALGTGGLVQSICASDFGPLLATLANHIGGLTRSYDLSNAPLGQTLDPGTLTVTVTPPGGQPYTVPQDSTNGWSYDATNAVLNFNGTGVPPPNSQVSISYGFLEKAFPLTHVPNQTTLTVQVTVNGQTTTVPESTNDPTVGWTYDTTSNSIVFGTNSLPPAGAEIDVSYRY